MNVAPPFLPIAPAKTSPHAIWSLVLGILSLFCLWILGSIPAIILGVIAIKKQNQSPDSIKGKGLAIAGIITGGVGIITGAFVALLVAASAAMPAYQGVQSQARLKQQQATLQQHILACRVYAADHEGRFPASLDELYPEYVDVEDLLSMTHPAHGESAPYLYRPGLTDTAALDEVLVATPWPVNRKHVIGRVGGTVEIVSEEVFQEQWAGLFDTQP